MRQQVAYGWLEWTARKSEKNICHFKNDGEVRLDDRTLSVDGFGTSSSTVNQFHSCFWHEHPCTKTSGVDRHSYTGRACVSFTRRCFRKIPTCLVWATDWLLCGSVSGNRR